MDKEIKLIIVTPEKKVLEQLVESVVLPAHEGELGVLPGHIPYMCRLKKGVLRYKSEEDSGEFAIMGGFAQVVDNTVSVFAEGAELAREIDAELERQKIQKLKNVLALKDKTMDIETAQVMLKEALVRIKIATRYQNK